MLPTRHQLAKWSLPSKWSFWAAIIGITLGFVSLVFTLLPFFADNRAQLERQRMLFQTVQELRYNDEWLGQLNAALISSSKELPLGALKSEGLLRLAENHHDWLVHQAYGEEKYIYQLILELRDLGVRLGSPVSKHKLEETIRASGYTLNDVHFLSNFLFWYLRPHAEENLTAEQLYSLGWSGLPGDNFKLPQNAVPNMKRFTHDGKPIVEYSVFLGLID